MKTVTYAMATKLPNYGETIVFGVLLDRVSYITEVCARTNLPDPEVQAFLGYFD